MAFRPLYSLTAVYGALSVLLWSFGYQGTPQLPGFLGHAHEMIWGYAGGVVVAFLLTAVATWTGKPPVSGQRLARPSGDGGQQEGDDHAARVAPNHFMGVPKESGQLRRALVAEAPE